MFIHSVVTISGTLFYHYTFFVSPSGPVPYLCTLLSFEIRASILSLQNTLFGLAIRVTLLSLYFLRSQVQDSIVIYSHSLMLGKIFNSFMILHHKRHNNQNSMHMQLFLVCLLLSLCLIPNLSPVFHVFITFYHIKTNFK